MTLRRIVTAATTMIVAIVLAIFVPVAQLQTVSDQPACCCPDPHNCKCPEHKPVEPGHSTLRACHGGAPDLVRAQLPQFVPPATVSVPLRPQPAVVIATLIPEPHAAPAPRRPDAPS